MVGVLRRSLVPATLRLGVRRIIPASLWGFGRTLKCKSNCPVSLNPARFRTIDWLEEAVCPIR